MEFSSPVFLQSVILVRRKGVIVFYHSVFNHIDHMIASLRYSTDYK